jgi:hypothetical protein
MAFLAYFVRNVTLFSKILFDKVFVNSSTAKSILAGEKLVATYSISM